MLHNSDIWLVWEKTHIFNQGQLLVKTMIISIGGILSADIIV